MLKKIVANRWKEIGIRRATLSECYRRIGVFRAFHQSENNQGKDPTKNDQGDQKIRNDKNISQKPETNEPTGKESEEENKHQNFGRLSYF